MIRDKYSFLEDRLRQICEEHPDDAHALKAYGLVLKNLALDNNHNTIAILRDAEGKLKMSLELDKDPETYGKLRKLYAFLHKAEELSRFHPISLDILGRAQEIPESSSTEEASNMANAEERNVRPRITYCCDSTLPSSWWELINKKFGICYYWNNVTNVIQYERPFCLLPIQPPMSTVFKRHRPTNPLVIRRSKMFSLRTIRHSTPMLCSEATNILPTFARLSSFTSCVQPSMGMPKDSLYFSFVNDDGEVCWNYLNLREREKIVKDSGWKQMLITTFLDEPTKDSYATFIAVNSSIYRIVTSDFKSSATSLVHVFDFDLKGLFAPSWKEFTSLVKARDKPWAVHIGGKIYVVGADGYNSNEINEIEVLTVGESSKLETLPLRLFKIRDWTKYFVVAVEDLNKIVIGSASDRCLFVYDVCTHYEERLEMKYWMPWSSRVPPVVVGNKIFVFCDAKISAFDLVEKSCWHGTIDGLGIPFFLTNCNENEDPKLIYLGGGILCLICVKSDTPDDTPNEDTVHVCLFGVPEFIREQGGSRSLHGVVHSIHKFYMGNIAELSDVLLI